MNNTINIQTDTPVDPEKLVGKFIYINNDKAQNGAYRIIGVSAAESGEIELNTGDVSLIRSYKDPNDTTKGFNYNIASGQSFRIPLSEVVDNSPVFSQIEEKTVDARSEIRFNVSATSPLKKALTYRAVSLPRGASFIPETRTFVWIPDDKQVGAHHAAIEVFDGALTTTQHIAIEVLGATSGKKEKPPVVDNDTNNDSQPDGQQPVVQQPQPVSSERFTDLNGFEWASDAINQLAEVGIITGTGENTFSPKLNVTRADFVLLLTRAFKLTGEAESFTDVPQDAYYAQAISAARQNEIITGLGDNRFLPTAEISREDMMVILTRAMAKAGITLTARDGALDGFPDAGQISDYARESVALLVSEGIVTGANGTLNPKGKATRAEIAVILQRILQRYKNISQ